MLQDNPTRTALGRLKMGSSQDMDDRGYLGPQHESSPNADGGHSATAGPEARCRNWKEEFRRLIEAEYQYELLDQKSGSGKNSGSWI